MAAVQQALTLRPWRSRGPKIPVWAPSLAVGLAVLGTEIVLAASIADPRFQALVPLVVGAGALALVFRWPLVATAGVVVLTASVFHEGFFGEVQLGPVGARPYELLLVAVLIVAAVRPKRATWGGTAGAALALFLVAAIVCTLLAVSAGEVTFGNGYQWLRPFSLLTLFFAVVRLCEDEAAARRLLAAAAGAAVLSAVVALLLAYGDSLDDTFQDPAGQFVRQEDGISLIDRVRLPAVAIAYALAFYAIGAVIRSRGIALAAWAVTVAALILTLAVSLNRNMWVGVIAGTLLLFGLWNATARARLVKGLIVGAVGLACVLSLGQVGSPNSVLKPLAERGASVSAGLDEKGNSSLRDRERETRKAWTTLGEHPVIGIGAGTPYGAFISAQRADGRTVRVPQRFLHNQYLYIALMAGIPGLFFFLLFVVAILRQAFARDHRRADLVACGVGVVVCALSAVVMLSFSTYNFLTVFALLCGCIIVMASEVRAPSLRREPDPLTRSAPPAPMSGPGSPASATAVH